MCMKTKTSFRCGHCIKNFLDCCITTCTTVDKLEYVKSIDCPECRASGQASTRGVDGRGRHGREKTRNRERTPSPSPPRLCEPISPTSSNHAAVSPWAPSHRPHSTDKIWDTPTRQMADIAWLAEHQLRMSDLDDKTSKHFSKTKPSRREASASRYERIIELNEYDVFDTTELSTPPKNTTVGFLKYDYDIPVRSAPDLPYPSQRSRKVSYDSSGSMPHYQESPCAKPNPQRSKTIQALPIMLPIAPPENHQNKARYKPRRTRTDPYIPQSCCFDSFINNPVVVTDPWISQYEVVQPLRPEYQYIRTYPVY